LQQPTSVSGVIVADDDPIIRSVLRARLEAVNLNVFLACDGLEAVEFASRIRSSLIFLDLSMPRMNGLIACKQIRKLPGNAKTPIVILTSVPGKVGEEAAARVGATAYYTKPFRPAELLRAVLRYLPLDDAGRDLLQHSGDLTTAVVTYSHMSRGAGSGDTPEPLGELDRNKDILRVLRG
jgi:CheY-like chemotaxis protein